jgi:hypothetical protein
MNRYDRFRALLTETLSNSLPPGTQVTIRPSDENLEPMPDPAHPPHGVGLPIVEACVRLEILHDDAAEAVREAHAIHTALIERFWERVPLSFGWRVLFQADQLAGEEYVELARLDEARLDVLLLE